MNIELKPCPFCGGKAEIKESAYSDAETRSLWTVQCDCGAIVYGTPWNFHKVAYNNDAPQDVLSAVERWNTRVKGE